MFEEPPQEYIPEAYLTAIGQVCVNWGRLETVVDLAIARLAAFDIYDPRGAIITAHMTWPLKMDVLEAFAATPRIGHPGLAKFPDVKPLLKKAQDGRNRVVHGQWGEKDGKVLKARLTARGKLRSSLDEIAVTDIEGIAADIFQAGRAVLRVIFEA